MYPVYICVFLHESADDNATYIDLVLVPAEFFKDSNELGYRKRQFLSITTRHQRKGQRKMLELKEVKKKKNKNKQAKQKKKKGRKRNRPTRKEQKKKNKGKCWN